MSSTLQLAKRRELPNVTAVLEWFNANVKSSGFIKGVPKNIYTNLTQVGNVGTGQTVLHSFTMPANSLSNDGDYLFIDMMGSFATNTNTKQILFIVAGLAIEDIAGLDRYDGGSTNGWRFLAKIGRINSTQIQISVLTTYGFLRINSVGTQSLLGAGNLNFNRNRSIGVSNLNNNSLVINASGTSGAASNDVLQNMSTIELTQLT